MPVAQLTTKNHQFIHNAWISVCTYLLAADEKMQIKAAIAKVVADMKSCIGFPEVSPSDPSYKVKITPFADDG